MNEREKIQTLRQIRERLKFHGALDADVDAMDFAIERCLTHQERKDLSPLGGN